jgi:hypothetical protein
MSIYIVVTPSALIMLRTDDKMKSVGKLYGWASLNAIEKIKHGLNNND